MVKVTKVLLKPELKPLTCKDKEFIDKEFECYGRLTSILNTYVNFVYPAKLVKKGNKIDYPPNLREETYEYLDKVIHYYSLDKPRYAELEQRGLADIVYDNAYTAFRSRSLPDISALADVMPVRISKRPLKENLKNKSEATFYSRNGTILYDNSNNFVFRLGRERGKKGYARFIIATKALNDITRFNMLREAIEGSSNITVGDPCLIVKRGNRYFLHVVVSKNVDAHKAYEELKSKDIIRIVGVDLGISRLATLFCIEVKRSTGEFRLIDAESIEGKQFINAIVEYEEERSRKQSKIMKGKKQNKKISRFRYKDKHSYTITNRKGESRRIDLRRQIIGYAVNRIIKFAKEHNADIIVIERLRGLSRELRRLRSIRKFLGNLYNAVAREGIQALTRELNSRKKEEEENNNNNKKNKNGKKTKADKEILDILNAIKGADNNKDKDKDKDKAMRLILRYKRMIEKRQFLLSVFAYYQFKEELKTEALWNGILLRHVSPSYTSQKCVRCGSVSKLNRLTQRMFKCSNCKWDMNADYNASLNIALRYAENVMKVKVMNLQQGKGNSSSSSGTGATTSTGTITSAVTPLHASINAGSGAGLVVQSMSGVQANVHAGSSDRRSLIEGANRGTACMSTRTLDECMHDRKGNGG